MSSVALAALIGSLCSGATHQEACVKAVTASTMQVGVAQDVEMVEGKMQEIAKQQADKYLGKTGGQVVVLGAAAVKIGQGKEAEFKVRNSPVSDNMVLGASKSGGSVKLGWDF